MADLAFKHELLLLLLLSALSGVGGSCATLWWQHKAEMTRIKMALLAELQAFSTGDPRFIVALNKVPLIFNGSTQVMQAFERVVDSHQLPGDHLVDLMIAAMSDAGLPHPHRDSLNNRYDTKPKDKKPKSQLTPKEQEENERWGILRRAVRAERSTKGAALAHSKQNH